MKPRAILAILILMVVLAASSPDLAAQNPLPPLPADLLFVTSGAVDRAYPRDTIMRVDAETLELVPFYVDAEVFEVLPISWSPQGDLLAIYRILPPVDEAGLLLPRQLCILNRTGALQRCLDDSPSMHYGGLPEQNWTSYYPVVWGPDGQTIYFDTEYVNDESLFGYGRRVVEASTLTGETLRILYDYPDPYGVTLSPDLTHLAVGMGGQWYLDSPAYLYNLTTETQLNIPDLEPENVGLSSTCWPFSPSGHFVTATFQYNVTHYAPNLAAPDDYREGQGSLILILDTQGTIQHIVAEPAGSPASVWDVECPFWQSDGQAIVFIAWDAYDRYLMHYSLVDRQMTSLYKAGVGTGHESHIYSPLIPSPDGSHIAMTVSDVAYGDLQMAVLYPDGEIRRIPNAYRVSVYPLWVPPLSE